jgi:hypothetical protein
MTSGFSFSSRSYKYAFKFNFKMTLKESFDDDDSYAIVMISNDIRINAYDCKKMTETADEIK